MQKIISIAISGVGNRALPKNQNKTNWIGWINQIKKSNKFNLVAAHDISMKPLNKLVEKKFLKPNKIYTNFNKMLENEKLDAILISNPVKFHYYCIKKSLEKKLYILVEKPFVSNLKEAQALLKQKNNKNISVVQNWRTKDSSRILRNFIKSGKAGKIGQIFFRYIRNRENPNYPKYLFKEDSPALYAMGIHHLDLFRYLLNDEIKIVSGRFFKPYWSLYSSSTGVNLTLITKKKTIITYTSTLSSLSKVSSQESCIINGSKGSIFNESDWFEPHLIFKKKGSNKKQKLTAKVKKISTYDQYNISDLFILNNLYDFIVKKRKPICSARDAFNTIKLLHYCKKACMQKKEIKVPIK